MFGRKTATPLADKGSDTLDLSASLARALRTKAAAPPQRDNTREEQTLEALTSIEAAFFAIDQIREIIVQASEIVLKAMHVDALAGRALLAEQYDELRESLGAVIAALEPDAARLVGPQAKNISLSIGASTYVIHACRLDLAEAGLNLEPPVMAFEEMSEIATTLGQLETALARIDRTSGFYMKDTQYLISRLEHPA